MRIPFPSNQLSPPQPTSPPPSPLKKKSLQHSETPRIPQPPLNHRRTIPSHPSSTIKNNQTAHPEPWPAMSRLTPQHYAALIYIAPTPPLPSLNTSNGCSFLKARFAINNGGKGKNGPADVPSPHPGPKRKGKDRYCYGRIRVVSKSCVRQIEICGLHILLNQLIVPVIPHLNT